MSIDRRPNIFISSLAQTLSAGGSETEVFLSTIMTLDGQTIQTSDFQYFGRAIITIDPLSPQVTEFASFTGVDSVGKGLTGLTRGLSFQDNTVIPANKKFHIVGAPVIISFGTHDIIDIETNILNNYNNLVTMINAIVLQGALLANQTTTGIVRTSQNPNVILGNPIITSPASPGVVTLASHGLTAGDSIVFTTTGTLPAPINSGQTYYVLSAGLTTNTFEFSATIGGIPIVTIGTQTGTHTLTRTTAYVSALSVAITNALNARTNPLPSTSNYFLLKSDLGIPTTYTKNTISFTSSTQTISDSANGFVTAGFQPGQQIIVTGSASNNGTFTVVSVASGAIVVVENLTDELAGNSVTITGATNGKIPVYGPSGPVAGNAFPFLFGANATVGQSLSLTRWYQSDGGIKLDTQIAKDFSNNTNPSQSLTVANNANRVLLAGITATSSPSNVTYAGVSMTLIDSQSDGTRTLYTYYLIAPAVGTANIAVTGTGVYGITGASYYNVVQSSPVSASAKATSGSNTVTTSLVDAIQCGFMHVMAYGNASTGITAVQATYNSRYKTGLTATTVSSIGSTAIAPFSISVGEFDETATLPVTSSTTGGSGTVNTTAIAILLQPFTAPVGAVVLTNSSAITNNAPLIDFIGSAASNTTQGSIGYVNSFPFVPGFSTLTAGSPYYLTDTPGSISTTPGTYGRCVGFAISSSTIESASAFMQKNRCAAISKLSNTTYFAECDGFLVAVAVPNSTITIAGVSTQAGVTIGYQIPITFPVSRGQSYSFTTTGSPSLLEFVPYI